MMEEIFENAQFHILDENQNEEVIHRSETDASLRDLTDQLSLDDQESAIAQDNDFEHDLPEILPTDDSVLPPTPSKFENVADPKTPIARRRRQPSTPGSRQHRKLSLSKTIEGSFDKILQGLYYFLLLFVS